MQAVATVDAMPFKPWSVNLSRPVLRDVTRNTIAPAGALALLYKLLGIEPDAASKWDTLIATRMRFRKGATLFHAGDAFTSLYAIRSGSCKTVIVSDGQDQVIGYHMPGDLLDAHGIGDGRHSCRAIALEDTEVCVLPFDRIEALARDDETFQHQFYRMLARDMAHSRTAVLTLGMARAEQRLAAFLLDLSQRYAKLGYSSSEFVLRMTREEIGSHLGLKLETVSRLFSRFHQLGIAQVQGRTIKLVDRVALQRLVDRNAEGDAGPVAQRMPAAAPHKTSCVKPEHRRAPGGSDRSCHVPEVPLWAACSTHAAIRRPLVTKSPNASRV